MGLPNSEQWLDGPCSICFIIATPPAVCDQLEGSPTNRSHTPAHLFQDTHLGLYTRRAFILVFYPHFSHPQRPSNPSPPSHNDSLLASLTPVIPPLFAWQRAFGDLSFEITSPRLGSPVPPGLLTETRSCVPPSSLFHPTYSSYSTCNALLVFFTSPHLFSFTFYFLLHTSQRGDVVLCLPELATLR
ncbi:hypothetical protein BGY98DRAFT_59055 [Russula aff. rugulosa BPL654]|nr:hypothetical protein BGY98DRAFT_59055 [Russula aff. rugulosa BPL654]